MRTEGSSSTTETLTRKITTEYQPRSQVNPKETLLHRGPLKTKLQLHKPSTAASKKKVTRA